MLAQVTRTLEDKHKTLISKYSISFLIPDTPCLALRKQTYEELKTRCGEQYALGTRRSMILDMSWEFKTARVICERVQWEKITT